jgi:AbrB family looped-hinge helix DNA binding protein
MGTNGVRVHEKEQVTIPRSIREKLNLKPGDLVIFQETESGIVLMPAAVVPKEDHRADMTALVTTVREKFKEYSADEISSLVEQAVRTARGEKG